MRSGDCIHPAARRRAHDRVGDQALVTDDAGEDERSSRQAIVRAGSRSRAVPWQCTPGTRACPAGKAIVSSLPMLRPSGASQALATDAHLRGAARSSLQPAALPSRRRRCLSVPESLLDPGKTSSPTESRHGHASRNGPAPGVTDRRIHPVALVSHVSLG
jgi:hypothetical protein